MSLIFEKETYAIRGAVFEVYQEMGVGFLEGVYQECLEKEFKLRNIPFVSQPVLKLSYKNEKLNQTYKADLICYDQIVIELKAVKDIMPEHQAQLMNYLKITGLKLGLLINFGSYNGAKIKLVLM